ncbi:MAG: hypothetical protein HC934_02730 [Acaryochloridaceae cyanobacterium SU_2_1]|nr:hypothetical protein [Acaryochloridaceae cyanobacterium SU_2_1]NJM95744.1 hypothetical protein [Acaryochloridaceae cyanobacterium CSU_5_19]
MTHEASTRLPPAKNRTIAILLALLGLLIPGLHKVYLGQFRWGAIYLIPGLVWATLPLGNLTRIASLCDALIYLSQGETGFDQAFNPDWPLKAQPSLEPEKLNAIAQALRQLEALRQEGLVTEYEFEQQRRQLLG